MTGSPNAQGYVAGARSDQSNITLDGVDVNDAQSNSLTGVVLRLNAEAIEEFRVTTVNANANQGRSSAAQINLVTKSGTNTFHGALFEYHRNTIFTSNNFFSNRAGVPRAKLIRNTYGGAVGGPIKKDKLFFFYSYEGRRDASGTPVTRTVPLTHVGQGQMKIRGRFCTNPVLVTGCGATQTITLTTADLNTMFPAVLINPAAVSALQAATTAYPVNDPLSGDGLNTGGFRFNASTPVDLNSNVAKIDWNINSKMSMFVRANFIYDLTGLAPAFPNTPAPNRWEHPWGVAVNHNWTLGRNWVNSFRYGLTRAAISQQGDSTDNAISFRFIFSPRNFARTLARTTPVHNFVNDVSWIHGNHTVNFGTNVRITGNSRVSFGSAFDSAITNPSFYQQAGAVVSNAISAQLAALTPINVLDSVSEAQNAATALIGRYSQYTARFTFGATGTLLPSGTATDRRFNTREYDFYAQDSWKIRRDLTITLGLRYGLSQPVYESKGFGVVTDISGADYLQRRIDAGLLGNNYAPPLTLSLAGGSGKGSLYNWDKNNFQPRVAAAWSPHFENKLLQLIFGSGGKSVLRGGFGITNDYYGQALAVLFDLNNTLGFSSNTTISANTYNVTTAPAPQFTGYNQQIRPLPGITVPGNLTFPRQQPSDMRRRIEGGLDTKLTAPINYVWNFTIERELPAGLVVQANYTGRLGRKLLATRDVMAITNLRDPLSKVDWYTAATQLEA
ncbi:MAG: TonB-dependent receptor, partial [Acidobacteria bacterium]|nr:TonB-dependent receptor [Acidobacteriota bacterium]